MNLRNVLLTLHITSAMLLIGWLSMQGMLVPRLIRQGPSSLGALRFAHQTAERMGRLSGIVFLLGLWLVFRADDGVEIGDGWVSASMGLFVAAAVLGAVFFARTEAAAIAKLEQDQPAPGEAARAAILGGVNNLIVLTIIYLMVAKP